MAASIHFSDSFVEIFKKSASSLTASFEPNHQSIKHVIEYLGIPHTEVGSIQVHGREVEFHYRPQAGDHFWVDSLRGPVNVTQSSKLRPGFPNIQFIVDECVASLSPKLRMLGFDVMYDRKWNDQNIAEISLAEKRVVLTRDRGLLMRKEVVWGRFIRATDTQEQLKEVMDFFALKPQENALQRCLVCNGELVSVRKEDISHQLAPKTREFYEDFSQCSNCGKIYWEGSHFEKMKESLNDLRDMKEKNSQI